MNVVLTGFMATGKSSVGKLIAGKWQMNLLDTDEEIEKTVRMTVSDIFARYGEPYFRDLETEVIKKVAQLNNYLITVGGGAVLRSENMDWLEKTGIIVCLTAKPESIYDRIKTDQTRPLLKVPDPLTKIRELLIVREPYYQRCKFKVDTTDLTISQVTDVIIKKLTELGFFPT